MEEWQYLRVLFIGNKDDGSILSILPNEILVIIAKKSLIDIGLLVADNLIKRHSRFLVKARSKRQHYERMIYLSCNHIWERENTYCGPYDKPPWVCKLCYADRDDWPVGCGCKKCQLVDYKRVKIK